MRDNWPAYRSEQEAPITKLNDDILQHLIQVSTTEDGCKMLGKILNLSRYLKRLKVLGKIKKRFLQKMGVR